MNVGRADLLAGGLRGSVRLSLRRMVLLAQQVHALLEKELDEVDEEVDDWVDWVMTEHVDRRLEPTSWAAIRGFLRTQPIHPAIHQFVDEIRRTWG